MPNYAYKCPNCGKEIEEIHSVEDRYKQKCPYCKDNMRIMIKPTAFQIFTPFWHPNLDKKPVWVKSKEHLKQLDKKYNMTSYY